MSVEAHLHELERRHKFLDAKIIQIQKYPSTRSEDITGLKLQKLHLKEEIEALRVSA